LLWGADISFSLVAWVFIVRLLVNLVQLWYLSGRIIEAT
jgi:hypothetical protein